MSTATSEAMAVNEAIDGASPIGPQMQSAVYWRRDLARVFGVNAATIREWTVNGILPPPRRMGLRSFWTREQVVKLLAEGAAAHGREGASR